MLQLTNAEKAMASYFKQRFAVGDMFSVSRDLWDAVPIATITSLAAIVDIVKGELDTETEHAGEVFFQVLHLNPSGRSRHSMAFAEKNPAAVRVRSFGCIDGDADSAHHLDHTTMNVHTLDLRLWFSEDMFRTALQTLRRWPSQDVVPKLVLMDELSFDSVPRFFLFVYFDLV